MFTCPHRALFTLLIRLPSVAGAPLATRGDVTRQACMRERACVCVSVCKEKSLQSFQLVDGLLTFIYR